MMPLRFLLVVGILLATVAVCQESSDERLIADSLAIQGQQQRPAALSIHATLTRADQPKVEFSFELVVTGPSSYKTRITGENYDYVYVRTPRGAEATENGRNMDISPLTLETERCPFMPLFGIGQDLLQGQFKVGSTPSSTGTIQLDIRPLKPLRSPYSERAKSRLEIDPGTKLPVMFESTSFHPFNPSHTATQNYRYGDYKRIGPLLLPYTIQVAVNGEEESTIRITAVDFDPVVPTELMEVQR
jgi:hypothetical protein